MRTVYKFVLGINQENWALIEAPGLDDIVLAGSQGTGFPSDHWVVWAECDTDLPVARKKVYVIGTGHERPPEPAQHAMSYQDGEFIWHIYDHFVS